MAQSDYFLKIDGVPGESADSKHKGEIELESFSWGETNLSGPAVPAGSAAGKVSIQDLHVVMRFNKASPQLFLACASGQHLKSAVLTARKAGKQQDFLFYRFTDILVSSYQTGGSTHEDDGPIDQVSLSFAKIEIEYRPQKADGSFDAPIKAGWDVKKGKKI